MDLCQIVLWPLLAVVERAKSFNLTGSLFWTETAIVGKDVGVSPITIRTIKLCLGANLAVYVSCCALVIHLCLIRKDKCLDRLN